MALSEKGTKTAKDKIKRDEFIKKFKELNPGGPKLPKKPKGPKRLPFPKIPKDFFLEKGPFKPVPKDKELLEKLKKQRDQRKSGPAVDKSKKKKRYGKEFADGGKAEKFGMLSVKAGVDNNPNPTQADRIVGATKKKNGGSPTLEKGKVKGVKDAPEERRKEQKKKKKKMPGLLAIGIEIIKPKKPIKAANGGLAGRLAKRGYGKARS
tara:strand:+ start:717 stop:1340 length:624 start_codon:yes stop_codon:yes gene_type:complete